MLNLLNIKFNLYDDELIISWHGDKKSSFCRTFSFDSILKLLHLTVWFQRVNHSILLDKRKTLQKAMNFIHIFYIRSFLFYLLLLSWSCIQFLKHTRTQWLNWKRCDGIYTNTCFFASVRISRGPLLLKNLPILISFILLLHIAIREFMHILAR